MKAVTFLIFVAAILLFAIAPDTRADIGISNRAIAIAGLICVLAIAIWNRRAK
jgi:hypothetical protein